MLCCGGCVIARVALLPVAISCTENCHCEATDTQNLHGLQEYIKYLRKIQEKYEKVIYKSVAMWYTDAIMDGCAQHIRRGGAREGPRCA